MQVKYCAWGLFLCFVIPFFKKKFIYISNISSHAALSCPLLKQKLMLHLAFNPTQTLNLFLTSFLQSQSVITSNIARSTLPAQVLLKPTSTSKSKP